MTKIKFFQGGFSLLEIMAALLLLGILSGVFFNAFTTIKSVPAGPKVKAYNLARQELEFLYESVRDDTWGSVNNHLNVNHNYVPPAITLDGTSFLPAYVATAIDRDGDGQEDYRKVEMTVTW